MKPDGRSYLEAVARFRKRCHQAFGSSLEWSGGLYFAPVATRDWTTILSRFLLGESSTSSFVGSAIREAIRCAGKALFAPEDLVLVQGPWTERNDAAGECESDAAPSTSTPERVLFTWALAEDLLLGRSPLERDRYFGTTFAESSPGRTNALILAIGGHVEQAPAHCSVITRKPTTTLEGARRFIAALGRLVLHTMTWSLSVRIFEGREKLSALVIGLVHLSQRAVDTRRIRSLTAKWCRDHPSMSTVREVWLPYEAQPEQSAFLSAWRTFRGTGCLVFGDVHSTLGTLPLNILPPNVVLPDVLRVHGTAFPPLLEGMGWGEGNTRIELTPTLRYVRDPNSILPGGTLVLPYSREGLNDALDHVEWGVKSLGFRLKAMRPHPVTGAIPEVVARFESLRLQEAEHDDVLPSDLVCIGNSTVPLEQLERGTTHAVWHVPVSRSPLERFDNGLWEDALRIEERRGVLRLELKEPGRFILFPAEVDPVDSR